MTILSHGAGICALLRSMDQPITPLELERRNRHLTQDQLAALADVRRGTIARAERRFGINLRAGLRLARALDTQVEALFGEVYP